MLSGTLLTHTQILALFKFQRENDIDFKHVCETMSVVLLWYYRSFAEAR